MRKLNKVLSMMMNHSDEAKCYGYGIWLKKKGEIYILYFEGCDLGVSFISCFNKVESGIIVLRSNYEDSVWRLLKNIKKKGN